MDAVAGSAYGKTRPARRLGRAFHRRRRLRAGITQLCYVLAGVALGLLIPRIEVGFTVPRAEAAQMLLAVGAALITFIGVVFSLLFLVVQFASTTFTMRLNLFQNSPLVWHALALHRRGREPVRRRVQHDGRRSGEGPGPHLHAGAPARGDKGLPQSAMRAFKSINLASMLAEVTEHGIQILDGVYPYTPCSRTPRPGSARLCPTANATSCGLAVLACCRRSTSRGSSLRLATPRWWSRSWSPSAGRFSAGPRWRSSTGLPMATPDQVVLEGHPRGRGAHLRQDPALAFRVLVDTALRAVSLARPTIRRRPFRPWTVWRACCGSSSAAISTSGRCLGRAVERGSSCPYRTWTTTRRSRSTSLSRRCCPGAGPAAPRAPPAPTSSTRRPPVAVRPCRTRLDDLALRAWLAGSSCIAEGSRCGGTRDHRHHHRPLERRLRSRSTGVGSPRRSSSRQPGIRPSTWLLGLIYVSLESETARRDRYGACPRAPSLSATRRDWTLGMVREERAWPRRLLLIGLPADHARRRGRGDLAGVSQHGGSPLSSCSRLETLASTDAALGQKVVTDPSHPRPRAPGAGCGKRTQRRSARCPSSSWPWTSPTPFSTTRATWAVIKNAGEQIGWGLVAGLAAGLLGGLLFRTGRAPLRLAGG